MSWLSRSKNDDERWSSPMYRCHNCPKAYTSFENLCKHTRIHHPSYKCNRCGKPYNSESWKTRHELSCGIRPDGEACDMNIRDGATRVATYTEPSSYLPTPYAVYPQVPVVAQYSPPELSLANQRWGMVLPPTSRLPSHRDMYGFSEIGATTTHASVTPFPHPLRQSVVGRGPESHTVLEYQSPPADIPLSSSSTGNVMWGSAVPSTSSAALFESFEDVFSSATHIAFDSVQNSDH